LAAEAAVVAVAGLAAPVLELVRVLDRVQVPDRVLARAVAPEPAVVPQALRVKLPMAEPLRRVLRAPEVQVPAVPGVAVAGDGAAVVVPSLSFFIE
jgi:hypothetical protein